MRRVLQFLQPARDFLCDLLVIFLMTPSLSLSSSRSLADGEVMLEFVNDVGDSCCMFTDCLDEASVFNAKRDKYEHAVLSLFNTPWRLGTLMHFSNWFGNSAADLGDQRRVPLKDP